MRRWLPVGLLLALLPVPLLGWAGETLIRSLEEREAGLRRRDAESGLARHLVARAQAPHPGPRIPLAPERGDHIRVGPAPDGSFLAHPGLLRARHLAATDPLEALVSLDPAWIADAPDLRLAGLLAAGPLLAALGESGMAHALQERARDLAAEPSLSVAVRRWARGLLEPDPEALAAWTAEVESRATDIEELVCLGNLLAGREGLGRRVLDRLRLPDRARAIADRLAASGIEPPCVLSTGDDWYAVQGAGAERAAMALEQYPAWVAAWPGGKARLLPGPPLPGEGPATTGRLSAGEWTVDLEGHRILWSIDPAGLGPLPRLGLAGGLLAYSLLMAAAARALQLGRRRAEALASARGELIARVTHELRTPLTVLRMYAETLLLKRVPPGEQGHYLDTLVGEAARLGELVDRVAAAARGAEPPPEGREWFDPRPLLGRLADRFQLLADGGSVELEPGQPLEVLASEAELQAILEILLDNALRYSPRPAAVRLSAALSRGRAELAVSDGGPGVRPEERGRLFQPWSRGERAGRGGAGMGLFLARRTARALAGEVELHFPPAGGTIALLRIPGRVPQEAGCAGS